MVYVLHQDNSPLMPTSPAKARHLLRDSKAKLVNVEPFTIQLMVPSSKHVQPVIVGVDPGASKAGFAAIGNGKVLYQGEVALRTDICYRGKDGNYKGRMPTRAMYRRNRRGRKCRYRAPRYKNRAASRRKGRLPPSIQSRSDTTVKVAKYIAGFLPVSEIIMEVANFDTQAMRAGHKLPNWAYQRGELYGQENVKMYVRARDKYTCQYCGEVMPKRLEVDHIIPRAKGGTLTPDNLVTSCHDCNQRKGNRTAEEFGYPKIQQKVKKSLKAAAHTQAGKNATLRGLAKIAPVMLTYGYITKLNRIKMRLPKTHFYDAVVVAARGKPTKSLGWYEKMKAVSRGQRQQYKANPSKGHVFRKARLPYEVFGFRMWDKVQLPNGIICFIGARRQSGSFRVKDIDGHGIGNITYKKLKLVERAKTLLKITERLANDY